MVTTNKTQKIGNLSDFQCSYEGCHFGQEIFQNIDTFYLHLNHFQKLEIWANWKDPQENILLVHKVKQYRHTGRSV